MPRDSSIGHISARQCPKCGWEKSSVRDSRQTYGPLKRRRLCPECGFKWSTIEMPEENYAAVVGTRMALLEAAAAVEKALRLVTALERITIEAPDA